VDFGLDVLVSGASIAGPAAAFWLRRAGHRVTLVERAVELREAGQNVDVRGPSLALTGAYVLAGELTSASVTEDGLRAFERRMRPLVRRAQKLPPGAPRLAHPKSGAGVTALRTALRVAGSRPVQIAARRTSSTTAASDSLPRYESLGGDASGRLSCRRRNVVVVASRQRFGSGSRRGEHLFVLGWIGSCA
jgi:2-polyprenyl-6-methoxyphenol hydroxylase-like FAD-dependent oxidoreductase